jgi:hypothetical protein
MSQLLVQSQQRSSIFSLVPLINDLQLIDACMVEIGSYSGESTVEWARSGKFQHIFAIDPWENNYSFDIADCTSCDMRIVESTFDVRVEPYISKIHKLKGKSLNYVYKFDDNYFDFVYIDGSHQYEDVKADILAWKSKVKFHGIIAGHDYWRSLPSEEGNGPIRDLTYGICDGPKRAVDELFGKPTRVYPDSSWIIQL